MRLETADISLGGCYLELAITLEVGTLLNVALWLGDDKLAIVGKVVTRHSLFGNGIEFISMSQGSRHKLQFVLDHDNPTSDGGQTPGLETCDLDADRCR